MVTRQEIEVAAADLFNRSDNGRFGAGGSKIYAGTIRDQKAYIAVYKFSTTVFKILFNLRNVLCRGWICVQFHFDIIHGGIVSRQCLKKKLFL